MREPVPQRGGHLGVAEHRGPFAEVKVARGPDACSYTGGAFQTFNVANIFVLLTSMASEGVMMLLAPV